LTLDRDSPDLGVMRVDDRHQPAARRPGKGRAVPRRGGDGKAHSQDGERREVAPCLLPVWSPAPLRPLALGFRRRSVPGRLGPAGRAAPPRDPSASQGGSRPGGHRDRVGPGLGRSVVARSAWHLVEAWNVYPR
jgi:hypothetical protein